MGRSLLGETLKKQREEVVLVLVETGETLEEKKQENINTFFTPSLSLSVSNDPFDDPFNDSEFCELFKNERSAWLKAHWDEIPEAWKSYA